MAIQVSSIQPMTFSKISGVEKGSGSSTPFVNVLKEAADEYTSLQKIADADSEALALGDADNLAQIQINSLKAEAALQTTVQLTSRVVSTYKEIMQMNI